MKNTFAKLFELPNHQVIVHKDFDSEDEEYNIIAISQLQSGVMMRTTLTYRNEADRDKFYDSLSESDAEVMLYNFSKALGLKKEVQL